MTEPEANATPPAQPQPLTWWQRPAAKELLRIGIAVGLAWLAAKGIRVPGEVLPVQAAPVVVVNTLPAHAEPAK